MTINPQNTVFAIKRLMGLPFSDQTLQAELPRLPYTVVNQDNRPYVQVRFKGETKLFSPEAISALILSKMKTIAEDFLGLPVTGAVVAVPGYFNYRQRKSMVDAGAIAGLNIIRIISEPTAASIAYGFDSKKAPKKILVFDLGGGMLSVSILNVADGLFEVLATSGDTHLGGADFDDRVVSHLKDLYKQKTGKNITSNHRATAALKRAAENAKWWLTSLHQTTIEIENFTNGDDFIATLTRARFEELNADLFNKTLIPVQNVLRDSGLSKSEIDEIVPVGGSSRIPKIQQLLKEFFDGKELSKSVNAEEAVAYGAAIHAAALSDAVRTIKVSDVNSFTLGFENTEGLMTAVIPRNTRVPTEVPQLIEGKMLKVFEGEHPVAKDNVFLESVDLGQTNVTFVLDVNSMLYVSGNESIPIEGEGWRMGEWERKEAIQRMEMMKRENEMEEKATEAKNRLEGFLFATYSKIREGEIELEPREERKIIRILWQWRDWLSEHWNEDKEVYDEELSKIQKAIQNQLGQKQTFKRYWDSVKKWRGDRFLAVNICDFASSE
jgi:heat shock protein 5